MAGKEFDPQRRPRSRRRQDYDARCHGATDVAAERAGIDHCHPGEPAGRQGTAVSICLGDQNSNAAQNGYCPLRLCYAGDSHLLEHLR